MFSDVWDAMRRIAWVVAILLAFLIAVEGLRILSFFQRLSPILSLGFAAVAAAIVLYALWHVVRAVRRESTVPRPPHLPPFAGARRKQFRRYCRYLEKTARRLTRHPELDDELRSLAQQAVSDLRQFKSMRPTLDDYMQAVTQTEEKCLIPISKHLSMEASKHIAAGMETSIREIAFSPYREFRGLRAFARNAGVVLEVFRTFVPHPPLRDQYMLLRDVARVLARTPISELGVALTGHISRTPTAGRAARALGPALGHGLLTRLVGGIAARRCAAFDGWSVDDAVMDTQEDAADAARDLKSVVSEMLDDVLYPLALSADPAASEALQKEALIGDLTAALNKCLKEWEEAAEVTEDSTTEDESREADDDTEAYDVRFSRSRRRSRRRRSSTGVGSALRTFAQRVRYSNRIGRI